MGLAQAEAPLGQLEMVLAPLIPEGSGCNKRFRHGYESELPRQIVAVGWEFDPARPPLEVATSIDRRLILIGLSAIIVVVMVSAASATAI